VALSRYGGLVILAFMIVFITKGRLGKPNLYTISGTRTAVHIMNTFIRTNADTK